MEFLRVLAKAELTSDIDSRNRFILLRNGSWKGVICKAMALGLPGLFGKRCIQ